MWVFFLVDRAQVTKQEQRQPLPPFFFSSDNSQFCSTTPEETHFTNMKINRKVYLHIQIKYLCIAPK